MAALPAVFKAMDKSMSNRSASFAILITNTEDQLQKQIGAWQFFNEKNLIVTHSGMLEVAIKVAKLFMGMSNNAIDGVDFSVVEKSLLMIEDIAKKSRTVKTKLSNIEESVAFLRNLDDERKAALEHAVNNIRDEFAKASEMAA